MSKENKQKYYVIFTVMHQAYVYILPSTATKPFFLAPYSFKMVYFGVTEWESLLFKKKKNEETPYFSLRRICFCRNNQAAKQM